MITRHRRLRLQYWYGLRRWPPIDLPACFLLAIEAWYIFLLSYPSATLVGELTWDRQTTQNCLGSIIFTWNIIRFKTVCTSNSSMDHDVAMYKSISIASRLDNSNKSIAGPDDDARSTWWCVIINSRLNRGCGHWSLERPTSKKKIVTHVNTQPDIKTIALCFTTFLLKSYVRFRLDHSLD